jgi:hypothetical protein
MNMTITEALAEIKTIDKRILAKRSFIETYLYRIDSLRDPHEKDGGSASLIQNEFQAIKDLEDRVIALRNGIQKANETNKITVEGDERTIADWLVWRREISTRRGQFLNRLRLNLSSARDAVKSGRINFGAGQTPSTPADLIVNINEQELNKEHEKLQNILGQLDGQLSLKNATVMIA